MGQRPLLQVLKASNGAAKAHEAVTQEYLNGVRILLNYLTNGHVLGDSQSVISFTHRVFVVRVNDLRWNSQPANCQAR
jgi:hypothetical protein